MTSLMGILSLLSTFVAIMPTTSSNPNGLVCRSCISADSDWCYTSDTLQCTGGENMCLLQRTKVTGSASSSAAIRGCATKSVTSAGISLHKFVLTPAIACLLLLKLYF